MNIETPGFKPTDDKDKNGPAPAGAAASPLSIEQIEELIQDRITRSTAELHKLIARKDAEIADLKQAEQRRTEPAIQQLKAERTASQADAELVREYFGPKSSAKKAADLLKRSPATYYSLRQKAVRLNLLSA